MLELVGHDEALVDDLVGGEAGDIEVLPLAEAGLGYGPLDLLPDDVEAQLEVERLFLQLAARHEELPDGGPHPGGQDADGVRRNRHVSPAQQRMALLLDDTADDLLAPPALCGVPGQEDHAHAVGAARGQGDAQSVALIGEEVVGHLDQESCAVSRLRVGATGAPVAQVDQHLQPLGDDPVGLDALDIGHEAHAAGVVLEAGVV